MHVTALLQSRQLLILLLHETQLPVEVRKYRSWHWEQTTVDEAERVQVWQLALEVEHDWHVEDVELR